MKDETNTVFVSDKDKVSWSHFIMTLFALCGILMGAQYIMVRDVKADITFTLQNIKNDVNRSLLLHSSHIHNGASSVEQHTKLEARVLHLERAN